MLNGLFAIMPRPVMGASLLFAACFILINGLQTITSRMLDARRTLVIGLAMSTGLAVEFFPDLVRDMPVAVQPIMTSSLVVGTITALLLNLLFRLGQRVRASLIVEPASPDALTKVAEFFDARGRSWGARRDVIERASFGALLDGPATTLADGQRALDVLMDAVELIAAFGADRIDLSVLRNGAFVDLRVAVRDGSLRAAIEDRRVRMYGRMLAVGGSALAGADDHGVTLRLGRLQ